MSVVASEITGISTVCFTERSKHESFELLAIFVSRNARILKTGDRWTPLTSG